MWHTSRDIHCKSFKGICSYIENIIINPKEVHLSSSINFQYKMLLIEIGREEFIEFNSTTQKLQINLLKHFTYKIVIHNGKASRSNTIFSSSITVEDAFRREANMKCNIDIQARGVAFALRSENLKPKKLHYRRT